MQMDKIIDDRLINQQAFKEGGFMGRINVVYKPLYT
jgi:hypothetical protein